MPISLQTLKTSLKQFNLITDIKIIVSSNDMSSILFFNSLSIEQFSTLISAPLRLQPHTFLTAKCGNCQILPSRKAIFQFDDIEKEFSVFSASLATLDLSKGPDGEKFAKLMHEKVLISNQRVSELSAPIVVKFSKKILPGPPPAKSCAEVSEIVRGLCFGSDNQHEYSIFTLSGVVLNGNDLRDIAEHLSATGQMFYMAFISGGIAGRRGRIGRVTVSCYGACSEIALEVEDAVD
ncbi:hypothetical protein SS50377_21879 [Spironucleus salmonicida]|uniref:Uncharacterized protein n=1 Tax=Spironucleus salmonicida TaxID=348837 RepID=V6LL04_9EUKA|nr:hypothetical protein SS50377_21879 [Spironucleus salmonicida]|eukprot:EST44421.1 Hypothetical protein SS50377_15727 [Spironucleus salmonicida]